MEEKTEEEKFKEIDRKLKSLSRCLFGGFGFFIIMISIKLTILEAIGATIGVFLIAIAAIGTYNSIKEDENEQ